MPDKAAQESLNKLADEVFELTMLISKMRSRSPKASADEPTEAEFLALDLVSKRGTLSVGEIQREIGILPAQMSRLVRSLESKGGGLVKCSINEDDRRKIDVQLTNAGKKAHEHYRILRRATMLEFLRHMAVEDRETFMRQIRSFRKRVSKALKNK